MRHRNPFDLVGPILFPRWKRADGSVHYGARSFFAPFMLVGVIVALPAASAEGGLIAAGVLAFLLILGRAGTTMDAEGLTITFLGSRRIAWRQVQDMKFASRLGSGSRIQLLLTDGRVVRLPSPNPLTGSFNEGMKRGWNLWQAATSVGS